MSKSSKSSSPGTSASKYSSASKLARMMAEEEARNQERMMAANADLLKNMNESQARVSKFIQAQLDKDDRSQRGSHIDVETSSVAEKIDRWSQQSEATFHTSGSQVRQESDNEDLEESELRGLVGHDDKPKTGKDRQNLKKREFDEAVGPDDLQDQTKPTSKAEQEEQLAKAFKKKVKVDKNY